MDSELRQSLPTYVRKTVTAKRCSKSPCYTADTLMLGPHHWVLLVTSCCGHTKRGLRLEVAHPKMTVIDNTGLEMAWHVPGSG